MRNLRRAFVALSLLVLIGMLPGCATRPPSRAGTDRGERIALRALDEVGRRYRFGGDTRAGFDCSGLASYVHVLEGVVIPRTAAAQFAAGPRVSRAELRAGDLLFFRFGASGVDHVGVYIGSGEFVHAPGAGSRVRRARIDATWFAQRYAGAARWWRDAVAR